jgi:hypothetical protein
MDCLLLDNDASARFQCPKKIFWSMNHNIPISAAVAAALLGVLGTSSLHAAPF